jgi:cell division protein FtsB
MSAESGRPLRVVDREGAPPPSRVRAEAGEEARPGRPWLLLLLLAVIAVLGFGYASERGRVSELEGEVAAVQARLAEAQATIEAAEQRMDVVRAHVSDLASRIGLLQEAVDSPLSASGPSSGGPASAAATPGGPDPDLLSGEAPAPTP